MKVHATGVRVQSGIGKNSGEPYQMAVLKVQVAIEQVARENLQIKGAGFEENDMDIDPNSYDKFATFPYPCDLELDVTTGSRMGQITVIATGAKLIANQPANIKAVG